ncbi:hypothetical protein PHYPSEUDO_010335 [Phytophthora pseudosyringae]|uniref:Eukaryotic initiation factor 4E n=1 Tax=Phytophthora pseudosyringae TaxID=221518 RepID=A0A8T1WBA9_9STRA|nr:hypothetical protein PHYPSEUDO_010335 [Phytophthora pseudosyringae]
MTRVSAKEAPPLYVEHERRSHAARSTKGGYYCPKFRLKTCMSCRAGGLFKVADLPLGGLALGTEDEAATLGSVSAGRDLRHDAHTLIANKEVAAAPAIVEKGEEEEHPLQTGWSLWYDKKMPKKIDVGTYQSNLQKIATFSTVEDFWRSRGSDDSVWVNDDSHYIHVKRPSQLSRDVNLYLFRDQQNCAPMWEAFPQGGCWILKIKKKANVLGKMWQDLVFAALGEAFEELDVVGIAMAIRSKEDMLSVWNADNSDDSTRFAIGEKLKEILMLDSNTLVEYKFHANSIRDMSTFRNAKPYVFAAATTN